MESLDKKFLEEYARICAKDLREISKCELPKKNSLPDFPDYVFVKGWNPVEVRFFREKLTDNLILLDVPLEILTENKKNSKGGYSIDLDYAKSFKSNYGCNFPLVSEKPQFDQVKSKTPSNNFR